MRRAAAIGLMVLHPLACSDPVPDPDWQIYQQIVEQSPAQATDLPRCTALADPSLAGDCALSVALGLAESGAMDALESCAAVPESLWREECHFIAAERARSAGEIDTAIALCEQAGRFAADCAFHLWQRAMRSLALRIVLETMNEQQPKMRSVHARWSKRVSHISEFDAIFWRKLFRAVWDGVSRVDPDICASLDPDLAKQCQLGAKIHLHHALRAAQRSEAWSTAFCAGQPPPVSALITLPEPFPELDRFPDHPLHQAQVAAHHKATCEGGPPPPHPDPPRAILDSRTLKPSSTQGRTEPATQSR